MLAFNPFQLGIGTRPMPPALSVSGLKPFLTLPWFIPPQLSLRPSVYYYNEQKHARLIGHPSARGLCHFSVFPAIASAAGAGSRQSS
jgi:hypothetical protein